MNGHDGVAAAYTLKGAAAALHFDERRLLAWCQAGHVAGFQIVTPGGKWWIPSTEIQRLAALMLTYPDWEAALDVDA